MALLQCKEVTLALWMLLLGLPRPQQEPLHRKVTGLQDPLLPSTLSHLHQDVKLECVQAECGACILDDGRSGGRLEDIEDAAWSIFRGQTRIDM